MKPEELGNNLRKARELASVSQERAAAALGLPRTAVTKIESGQRQLSTLELTKLAALYQCSLISLVEGEDEEDTPMVALHRIAPGLEQDPAVQQEVGRYVHMCQEGINLERLLKRDRYRVPPSYNESPPRSAGEAVEQGERVADQERSRLGIGINPIVDMSDLINDQHIWASGASFPDKMSGLFLCHASIGMAIFVNACHSRVRKRFSYAHEYAHALLDRKAKISVSNADNASELIEKRANAFAAAFLLPRNGIYYLLDNLGKGKPSRINQSVLNAATEEIIDVNIRPVAHSQDITYQDIASISHHFGVSYIAATYRLRSLGYISKDSCSQLLEQVNMGKRYLKVLSGDDSEDQEALETKDQGTRELRAHIAHLAIEAYRREEISRGKIIDISQVIEIRSEDMLDLAEAACVH